MALFGNLSVVSSQLANPDHFAAAFRYAGRIAEIGTAEHEKLFRLDPGVTERVDLDGGAFALLQAYVTKPRAEGRWETHVGYVDVQVIYLGEEFMEVADRSMLTMHEDLTPGRDVIFYHPFSSGSACAADRAVRRFIFRPMRTWVRWRLPRPCWCAKWW